MATYLDYIDPQDVQVTLNGFNLYGTDEFGVTWHTTFQQINGLFDGVGSTLETTNKVWSDGLFSNVPTRDGRSITIDGLMYGACPEDLMKSWGNFKKSFALDDQVLEVHLGDIGRQVTVKQATGAPLIKWNGLTCLAWSISLIALSSYLYATGDPKTGSTNLPHTEGGFIYPKDGYTFEGKNKISDWRFTERVVSGSITITSDGEAPSPVSAKIIGPVVNPSFTHYPSGRTMTLEATIGAGTTVSFNGDKREILVNGSIPARGIVRRREWAYAVPGINQWAFTAEDYNPNAALEVSFREAYL